MLGTRICETYASLSHTSDNDPNLVFTVQTFLDDEAHFNVAVLNETAQGRLQSMQFHCITPDGNFYY